MADITLKTIYDRCEEVGECTQWMQGVNSAGRPFLRVDRKHVNVRRLVFTLSGGEIPPGHMVCVKCDNKLCLKRQHLVTRTRAEHVRLMTANGKFSAPSTIAARTAGRRSVAKITMEIAREIRASDDTAASLARKYGVHKRLIYGIRMGEIWREQVAGASVFAGGF